MLAATIFSGALACFLIGCAIAALATEPFEDAMSDWSDGLCGDWPFVPRNDESRFHSEGDTL